MTGFCMGEDVAMECPYTGFIRVNDGVITFTRSNAEGIYEIGNWQVVTIF